MTTPVRRPPAIARDTPMPDLGAWRRLPRAHAQAAAILAITLRLPGARAIERLTKEPTTEDALFAELPTTVLRPGSRPPWPALVFVNGATPDGRSHPMVRRLSVGLARVGYLVFVPELPGIGNGELTPATLTSTIELVRTAADLSESRGGRVGIAGVSIGGSLALLTAAAPELADRVTVVACVAPFTDLAKVIFLATTGMYRDRDRLAPHATPPYLIVGIARSLVATLPPTPANEVLAFELRALDPSSHDPLLPFKTRRPLDQDAAAVYELLANSDPERFDQLYAALPSATREAVEALSPLRSASRLVAPIEIATAPSDTYFPVAESLALARSNPHVTVTVTETLAHATPKLTKKNLTEISRLDMFFTRSLIEAGGEPAQARAR